MPDQVPVHVARERNRVLRELAAQKNLEFRREISWKDSERNTLQTNDEHSTEALSDNYLKVRLAGQIPANQWLTARITDLTLDSLIAAAR